MKCSVIDLENVQGVSIERTKLVQESLVTIAINMRELQEKLFSGRRFNGSIQPKRLELPLPGSQRLHSTQGDQSSDASFESKATLILSKIADAFKFWFCYPGILLEQVEVSGEVCLNAARWLAFCFR